MAKAKRDRQPSLFDEEPAAPQQEPALPDGNTAPTAGATPCETRPCETRPFGPDEPAPESLAGKTVWVVDAHSLIHQVFHAIPNMTSPHGEPVGAVFGFSRDMFSLLESHRPDYLFCAFDLPAKTFRHSLYADYKMHRPEMDVDLAPQIATIRGILDAMGIPAVGCESFEADDVMATLARQTEQRGGDCFLVTADKDCRQLITDRVKLYNIRKNQYLDRAFLKVDWGIAPEQVVDFQSLVGDPTDNVPGVPLIGPKFAQQLLEKYGTLEGVLEHACEVSGEKRRQNLIDGKETALLSRKLVQLDANVPCTIPWNTAATRPVDGQRLRGLFREYGLRSLIDRVALLEQHAMAFGPPKRSTLANADDAHAVAMREDASSAANAAADATTSPATAAPEIPPSPPIQGVCHVVDTPEALALLVEQLGRQTQIAVDLETTGIWARGAEIVGFVLGWQADEGFYVPVAGPPGERHLDRQATIEALRPILTNPSIEKIGQNLKYDMIAMRAAGIRLAGVAFDTMVASYLIDAGEYNHSLDEIGRRYLGQGKTNIRELIGSGKKQKRMDEVPIADVAHYAGNDVMLPVRLRPILAERLVQDGLDKLFYDVEMPLVEVLVEIESNGIKVDCQRLAELSGQFGKELDRLEDEIYALAGHPFNIASPKQLQQILFDDLKLPVVSKTKTGASTDADVLETLALRHPLPAKILEYRQYAKLKSTYVDALPTMVHPETQRIHASFHQAVTATGRLSSSDPNLQNIPIRTEAGRAIRSAFVPGHEGWLLLAADYSQIELRVLAHFSEDVSLCEAFARDEDIHSRVASQLNGVPLADVTESMRRQAKTVNFGVLYGQSPFGLAKQLSIPKEEASRFIDAYFAGYPGVDRFLDSILEECRRKGYVSTILGRRRSIHGIRPDSGRQKNLPERTAINTVVQGSAADLIKLAMISIHPRLRREGLSANMLLQIHDELVFETPASELPRLAALVSEEMSGAQRLRVPLKVDLKVGPNWADAKRWAAN
jgi:DNA polymerase-1